MGETLGDDSQTLCDARAVCGGGWSGREDEEEQPIHEA
jgi:hypothetical protein